MSAVIQFSVERVANGFIVTPKPGQPHIAMTAEDVGSIVAGLCSPPPMVARGLDANEIAAILDARPGDIVPVSDATATMVPAEPLPVCDEPVDSGVTEPLDVAAPPPSTYDPTTDGDAGLRKRARIRTTSIGDGE